MTIHQQNQKTAGPIERPLLLSCLTGSDRSGSIAVGIISVAATSAKRPSITSRFSLNTIVYCYFN